MSESQGAAQLPDCLVLLPGLVADAGDSAPLAASLADFIGHPAYGPAELRGDLERFVFLLGGSDGQALFGPDQS